MSELLRTTGTRLGEPFCCALRWALELHEDQSRKGKDTIPYSAHLLGVVSLVLEDEGSEVEAIAALLHDAMEDQGISRDMIAVKLDRPYGLRAAEIVLHCSDGVDQEGCPVGPRGPETWRARKHEYLAKLAETDDVSVLRVSNADKLHNARAIAADLREMGPPAWTSFNSPPKEQLWYYQSLAAIFNEKRPKNYLARELAAAVAEISRLTYAISPNDAADEL